MLRAVMFNIEHLEHIEWMDAAGFAAYWNARVLTGAGRPLSVSGARQKAYALGLLRRGQKLMHIENVRRALGGEVPLTASRLRSR